ncbi:hypothetical protein LIER_43907 [Lithospermum erythrorhizon]|uniref:DUF4283 domain-containing protein n=1 Tax=Lithospermum erythrorhizon TaxID=34254 RepID=A0AAV3R6M9_LITER
MNKKKDKDTLEETGEVYDPKWDMAFLKDSWKVKCKVIPHEKGWIVFRFDSDTDRQWVVDGQGNCSEGAYRVYGKMLSLRVLPDGFSHDDAALLKVPLWVKFPSLPQKYWTKSGFGKIGSMIGNFICPDQIIWDRSRTSYARFLIMVDISRGPFTSFTINLPEGEKASQRVEYELFPRFCCHCKAYRHNFFGCDLLNPHVVDVGLEPTVV